MSRVVIDSDLGIGNDDCQALVFALRSPELTIEALSVCAGNLTTAQSLCNALTLVEYLGRPGIPVLPGAPGPLVHAYGDVERGAFGSWGEQAEPVWPFGYPASLEPRSEQACEWLAREACASPGELTVIAIGPLTNVALALGRIPEAARAIGEIVCLGGCFPEIDGVGGNVTPHAEFNFWVDPDAARAVLSCGVRVRVVPLNLGRRLSLSSGDVMRIAMSDTRVGRLYATLTHHLKRNDVPLRLQAGDVLAVAAVVRPELFRFVPHGVDVVVTPGDRYGQSRLEPPDEAGTVAVAVECDVDAVHDLLRDRLAGVPRPLRARVVR